MNNGIKLLLLLIVSFMALYLNVWYMILPVAVVYGWATTQKIGWAMALSFASVFALWATCLYLRDGSFYRAPSTLLAPALGDIPSWAVPLIGGVVGGVVAMLGSLGGSLLRSSR